jgi:CheY-like chemotaxis protein
MTGPIVSFPTTDAAGGSAKNAAEKKKRVLLVDTCRAKREIRAETMRRLGAEVDCAADISEARGWWKPDLYDLVLLHVEDELVLRDKFCDDVRSTAPGQQIAFLVGKPAYIAGRPDGKGASAANAEDPLSPPRAATIALPISADGSQRWGILEACRRISAVRLVADARTRAMRDRPVPPRDLETAALKRAQILQSQIFAEIDRKGMQ